MWKILFNLFIVVFVSVTTVTAKQVPNAGLSYYLVEAISARDAGDHAQALELWLKLEFETKEYFGELSIEYALVLKNIGLTYSVLGDNASALNYHLTALNITKDTLGQFSKDYSTSLNDVGKAYSLLGNYRTAVHYYSQALEIIKEVSGVMHADYINTINNIGLAYEKIDDYNNALKYHKHAIDIKRVIFGEMHYNCAISLNNIASIYCKIGKYDNAFECYQQALDIIHATLGEKSVYYATITNNIGYLYHDIGDYGNALKYYKLALSIRKDVIGEHNIDYAVSINNIGALYCCTKDYNLGLEYLQQALYLRRNLLGDRHPDYATSVNNIGCIYDYMGDYDKALEYHQEALNIRKEVVGETHLEYAVSLNNVGETYGSLGNYNKALQSLENAYNIRCNALPQTHPECIQSLSNIVYTHMMAGDIDFAVSSIEELLCLVKKDLRAKFLLITEQERAIYFKTKKGMFAFGHQVINEARQYNTLKTHISYDIALFTKGLILSSAIELRKVILESGYEELVDMYDEANGLEKKLLKTDIDKVQRDSLNTRFEKLNRELMSRSKEFGDFTKNLELDWKDVQGALGKKDVAIEFVDFKVWESDTTQYSALVLRNGWRNPKMVNLFTEEEMTHYTKSGSRIYDGRYSSEVYGLIWEKLEEYLKEGDNVYFSPSGVLHQMNIEVLQDSEGKQVDQKYNLHRVSSTRQLCSDKPKQKMNKAALFGGLTYDVDSETMVAQSERYADFERGYSRGLMADSTERKGWNYLPSSKTEVETIAQKMNSKSLKAETYMAEVGTEEAFKALSGKRNSIIHIATHGFFFENEEVEQRDFFKPQMMGVDAPVKRDNSMRRSGLIMSGGQKAWLGEDVPDGIDDGVLLAEEIMMMDLRGTELVVLSACETGLGEVTSEGVFGLQRAFKKAGVETVLMSLWRVHDIATSLMMQTFYDELLSGKSKKAAFSAAQQIVRESYSEPHYWASFIMLD